MLRETRQLLRKKAQQAGRQLHLSVRVPFDLDESRREGMEVPTWIREQIVAQNLDGFREGGRRSAKVLFGEGDYYSAEMHRAVAARHLEAGANGIYIWNQDWIKFAKDDRFDPQSWREIGDPDVLAGLDKHCTVGLSGRGGSLPVEIAVPGDTVQIRLDVADDLSSAPQRPKAALRVLVEQLTSLDDVRIELNEAHLDAASATRRYNYDDCWLDFPVTDLLRKGWSDLSLTVEEQNPHVDAPLVVRSVEAMIRFGT